eukprot:TRINITY_DN2170_c0_g1_i3.p1 TRINITY_DN2170_c0_g1~~TRINITY_DN2170_c0_g1_i3.p1  ORF type:complete len:107 (-),score=8.08 TRINITY_DN2170_c0_g1_i3:34-354(-)
MEKPNRFEISTLKTVVLFSRQIDVENCAICRSRLRERCIQCMSSEASNETRCLVCSGTCDHTFHHHCIQGWVRQNNLCPLCRNAWQVARLEAVSYTHLTLPTIYSV